MFLVGLRVGAANDSSSATAEGGGAWRAGCAAGSAGSSQRDTRPRPEQVAAAPLLGVFSFRSGCGKESEKSVELALDEWSESIRLLWLRERIGKD